MTKLKDFLILFLTNKFFEKLTAYILLILFIYLAQNFLGIFLLTFIFSYLFLNLGKFIKFKIDSFFARIYDKKSKLKFFKKLIGVNFIIIILYVLFVGIIVFTFSGMIPKLINELSTITKDFPLLQDQISSITSTLKELKNNYAEIGGTISQIASGKDYAVILNVISKVQVAGVVFFQFILALILSLVFLIDRKRLGKYLSGIKKSNFKFLYVEYKIILEKIVNSFGLILKAQSMIAFINSILSVLGLLIIGFVYTGTYFPFVLTLGLLVFILGFIPVLGVFLSSIPIMLVAYNFVGGFNSVLAVVILVLIVHSIEAYYLNPKIVSSFLKLPVSLTFVILIISEHIFGFAGLLIGVSLFYFILGLLKDADKIIGKTKKKAELEEKIN